MFNKKNNRSGDIKGKLVFPSDHKVVSKKVPKKGRKTPKQQVGSVDVLSSEPLVGGFKTKFSKRDKFLRALLVLIIVTAVIVGVYFILKHFNLLEKVDSVEKIRALILSAGVWSYLVFFLLQFLQVTFVPIPSALSTLAGTVIFGPLTAFIYSTIAILLGSVLAFFLGRKYGSKIISFVVGKDEAIKFREKLSRGRYVFCLMLLFPGSPDDVLCLIAGTTTMTNKFFLTSTLTIRPISIFCLCFFGSGSIIPFGSWGIPIWIIAGLCVLALFILSIKYNKQIEQKINTLFLKLKPKIK